MKENQRRIAAFLTMLAIGARCTEMLVRFAKVLRAYLNNCLRVRVPRTVDMSAFLLPEPPRSFKFPSSGITM